MKTKQIALDVLAGATASVYASELIGALSRGEGGQKSLQALLKIRPIDAEVLEALAGLLQAAALRQRQQSAANSKHHLTRKAKEFVSRMWAKNLSDRGTNKAFSENAAWRVFTKFGVEVKPETIARDWLKRFEKPKDQNFSPEVVAFVDGRSIKKRRVLKLPQKPG